MKAKWPDSINADAHKGVVLMSLAQTFAGVNALLALPDMPSWLGKWVVGITYFFLLIANYYVLVARGRGAAFQKRFDHFSHRKRIALLSGAAATVVGLFTLLLVAANAHRNHVSNQAPEILTACARMASAA